MLDVARFGMDVRGVVSFHGLLEKLKDQQEKPEIKAKILVCHAHEDYIVSPNQVCQCIPYYECLFQMVEFMDEMRERKADWYLMTFGNAKHSFTVPHNTERYNPQADRRSWQAMTDFLNEIFV